jgi:hypothetical protein
LVESREKADLILRLDSGTRVRLVREGEAIPVAGSAPEESPVPPGYTRIALLQPNTGQMLSVRQAQDARQQGEGRAFAG